MPDPPTALAFQKAPNEAVYVPMSKQPCGLRSVRRAAFIGFPQGIDGVQVEDLDVPQLHVTSFLNVGCFVDSGKIERFDMVFVDADVFDPEIVSKILALRACLSDFEDVPIVATAGFLPGAFSHRLEQTGCAAVIKRGETALRAYLKL